MNSINEKTRISCTVLYVRSQTQRNLQRDAPEKQTSIRRIYGVRRQQAVQTATKQRWPRYGCRATTLVCSVLGSQHIEEVEYKQAIFLCVAETDHGRRQCRLSTRITEQRRDRSHFTRRGHAHNNTSLYLKHC